MRFAKKTDPLITPFRFQEAMTNYAATVNRITQIQVQVEEAISATQKKFENELYCLEQEKKQLEKCLETYCREQKSTLFSLRRSMQTSVGSIGFRRAKPKLVPLPHTDWPQILQQLKQRLPQYIRYKEEPAKDALLADKDKEPVAAQLQEIGLQVVQDELFFIDISTIPTLKMRKSNANTEIA